MGQEKLNTLLRTRQAGEWLIRAAGGMVVSGLALQGFGATPATSPLSVPAKQWVADACANEVKVLKIDNTFLRYEVHIVDSKGDKVRDVIESRDGTVARMVMHDGRPLTKDEDDAERTRLQAMLDSPAAFARHIKTDQQGKKFAVEIIGQIPAAMLVSYTAGQPQRAGHNASEPAEVVIDFTPDPEWKAPTLTSEALTGMRGRAWIDPQTHYLTRLEGEIFRAVNLGWGLFARLYPGGSVTFDQIRVADQRWIFSQFSQHILVRALMVKTIKQDAEIRGTAYHEIAPVSYQDAIHLLLARPLPGP